MVIIESFLIRVYFHVRLICAFTVSDFNGTAKVLLVPALICQMVEALIAGKINLSSAIREQLNVGRPAIG